MALVGVGIVNVSFKSAKCFSLTFSLPSVWESFLRRLKMTELSDENWGVYESFGAGVIEMTSLADISSIVTSSSMVFGDSTRNCCVSWSIMYILVLLRWFVSDHL